MSNVLFNSQDNTQDNTQDGAQDDSINGMVLAHRALEKLSMQYSDSKNLTLRRVMNMNILPPEVFLSYADLSQPISVLISDIECEIRRFNPILFAPFDHTSFEKDMGITPERRHEFLQTLNASISNSPYEDLEDSSQNPPDDLSDEDKMRVIQIAFNTIKSTHEYQYATPNLYSALEYVETIYGTAPRDMSQLIEWLEPYYETVESFNKNVTMCIMDLSAAYGINVDSIDLIDFFQRVKSHGATRESTSSEITDAAINVFEQLYVS